MELAENDLFIRHPVTRENSEEQKTGASLYVEMESVQTSPCVLATS